MIICDKCFAAKQLQETIARSGIKGDCPTCKNSNVYLMDTDDIPDKAPELIEWFSDLVSCFCPASQLPAGYSTRNINLLKTELKNNWNIFSSEIDDSVVFDIITSICPDLYEYRSELFNQPVALILHADTEFLANHALTYGKEWDDFVKEITEVNRYHAHSINLSVFERVISYLKVTLKKGSIFYRCRLTDKTTPFSPKEMGPPPSSKASSGRANAAGISCLYLANDIRTSIAEVRAGVFDCASIGVFELQRDIPVIDFRAIKTLCPVGIEMDYIDYALNRKHLEKIDSEMARGLKRGDHSIDYVATQYIADFVKSILIPDEKGSLLNAYWGIIYNSTLNPDGYNLAIFYKDVFECISTELFHIKSLEYKTIPSC